MALNGVIVMVSSLSLYWNGMLDDKSELKRHLREEVQSKSMLEQQHFFSCLGQLYDVKVMLV